MKKWSIFIVEDMLPDVRDSIRLYEEDVYENAPDWLFRQDDSIGSNNDVQNLADKNLTFWPQHFHCSHFHDAWQLLKNMCIHAEIIILDTDLAYKDPYHSSDKSLFKRNYDANQKIYQNFWEEYFKLKSGIHGLLETADETTIYSRLGLGGEALNDFIQEELKDSGRFPTPLVKEYTGRPEVRSQTLRTEKLKKTELDKALIKNYIFQRQRTWLESGLIDIKRTKSLLNDLISNLENDNKGIEHILKTQIGDDWTFGHFFPSQSVKLLSADVSNYGPYTAEIQSIIDALNFSKGLACFFKRTDFDVLCHTGSGKFKYSEHDDIKGKTYNQVAEKHLLATAIEEIKAIWKSQPFADNSEIKLLKALIDKLSISLGMVDNDLIIECEKAKKSMRIKPKQLRKQIELAHSSRLIQEFENGSTLKYIYPQDTLPDTESIENCFGNKQAFGPAKMFDNEKLNLLGELIQGCFYNIIDKNDGVTDHSVHIWVNVEDDQLILTLCQMTGSQIPQKSLKAKKYFQESGHFSELVERARGWVKIIIRSDNCERNVHNEHYTEFENFKYKYKEKNKTIVSEFEFSLTLI